MSHTNTLKALEKDHYYDNTISFLTELITSSTINIIGGEVNSGKTTLCQFIISEARKRKLIYNYITDIQLHKSSDYIKLISPNVDLLIIDVLHHNLSDINHEKEFMNTLKDISINTNCSIIITSTLIKSRREHGITGDCDVMNSFNLYLSADNVITIEKKVYNSNWIIDILDFLGLFTKPNTKIRLMKSRKYIINKPFFLKYNPKKYTFTDINRNSKILRFYLNYIA